MVDGCGWRDAEDWGLRSERAWRRAGGSVSWRAVPRHLLVAARRTARRMAEASAAKRRAAPSPLKATRGTASRMAGASGAKRRAAPSQLLEEARSSVWRMAEAGGAKRRAAPSPFNKRGSAWRMAEASGAKRRAASRQLLGVCARTPLGQPTGLLTAVMCMYEQDCLMKLFHREPVCRV